MNESQESHVFFGRTCKVTESSFVLLNQFPNKTYERSHVATLVINYILISMNGISIVTIRKSSQLRNKVCYFVILLQSIVDLSVGVLTIPLFIYYLMVPFVNTVNCTLIIFALRTLYLRLGLSITTLSAMALVRYIGVLHPFQYKTKITEKRILIYLCGHGLAFISVIAYSFRNPDVANSDLHKGRHMCTICPFWICLLVRKEGRFVKVMGLTIYRKQIIRESQRARS